MILLIKKIITLAMRMIDMPLRNLREYYRLRGYYPGPLVYPFKPMMGRIPLPVLDRLSFQAFESRRSGDPLGVFLIRAWQQIRYSHNSMLFALLDMGLVCRVTVARGQESWGWANCTPLSTARSVSEDGTEAGAIDGFFDVSKTSEFSSSVVVAPRISPTYSTPL